MNFKAKLLIALVSLSALVSCSDSSSPSDGSNNTTIPEASSGTVNVLVNDKVFFVRNPELSVGANYYETGDKRLTLYAADSNGAIFTVVTPSKPRPGSFPIHHDVVKDPNGAYGTYSFKFLFNQTSTPRFFRTSNTNTGSLTITQFDSTKRLISGSFTYTAAEEDPIWDSGRVHIRGSFKDIPYVKM
jgi:hypothetical protein